MLIGQRYNIYIYIYIYISLSDKEVIAKKYSSRFPNPVEQDNIHIGEERVL